eukprot:8891176-Pyramimonas_sp.AAC.1
MEGVTFPHPKSNDVVGSQGWVSRGRLLAVELLLYGMLWGPSWGHLGGNRPNNTWNINQDWTYKVFW